MIVHDLDAMTMRPIGLARHDSALDDRGRPYLVTRMLLVHTDADGWVVIDTGIGTADVQAPTQRLGFGFTQLVAGSVNPGGPLVAHAARLGIDPQDIRHVLQTHLDLDHAGGLSDLPWAQVHAHQNEIDVATTPQNRSQAGRYRRFHFAHGPHWSPLGAPTTTWNGLPAGPIPGLSDGWRWLALHGHTPGHCGFVYTEGTQTIVHMGDTFLEGAELLAPTRRSSVASEFHHRVFDNDRPAAAAMRNMVRTVFETATGDIGWYSGHDPRVLRRR